MIMKQSVSDGQDGRLLFAVVQITLGQRFRVAVSPRYEAVGRVAPTAKEFWPSDFSGLGTSLREPVNQSSLYDRSCFSDISRLRS